MTGTTLSIHTPRIVAKPKQFIALVGYAGAGKDVFANHLIAAGYVRHNYGDLIKSYFDKFTQGNEDVTALHKRMIQDLTPEKSLDDLSGFILNIIVPYALDGHKISAFTEDRDIKPFIRRILEIGGEMIYQKIQQEYNQQLENLLSQGKCVVNTRLCQLSEAASSKRYGHEVYLIERSNWKPASDWDEMVVIDLEDAGHIHHTVYNDAISAQGWDEESLDYVQHNILNLLDKNLIPVSSVA